MIMGDTIFPNQAFNLLTKVREKSPLIQCITNFVSMDITANTLLAVNSSPAMLHSLSEIDDFTPICDALYINIGTLTEQWLPSMRAAATKAIENGKPWVLDPVAVTASNYRMKACLDLVELKPSVVRGNASEILGLAAKKRDLFGTTSKGVDSSHESMDAVEAAKSLALTSSAIVAVSGAIDYLTDGHRVVGVHNGVPMMQKITATGCAVTALIAAFVSVDPSNVFEATACALSIFGLAGEVGMALAKGPASLRMHMIDSLHGLDEETLISGVRIASLC